MAIETSIKITRDEIKQMIERKHNVKIKEFTLSSAGFRGIVK